MDGWINIWEYWEELVIKVAEAVAQRCSVKKGVVKNFAKFTGKPLCQSLFFNRVPGLRPQWIWWNF